MLNNAGVAFTQGPVFGECAQGYVRLCYTNTLDVIKRAIQKMGMALKK